METYRRKQGDSLWLDIRCGGFSVVDSVWPNWTGTWGISSVLGDTPILTGNLSRSETPGVFQLRVGSNVAGYAALPVGTYLVTAQAVNTGASYCQETQCELITETQGLP